ncbi:MAG: transposase [Lachnospiraceae bacterium]|nr:transposase [Lachnospiraceae bacterium]
MKRSRFSEEQIIGILRQAEVGIRVVDLCRKHGISDATFYKCGQSTAAWMFPMPCVCASLRRRTLGSGRWWTSSRWTFPSSRMSC